MVAHFAHVTEEKTDKIKEDSISTRPKQTTWCNIFQDEIFNVRYFYPAKPAFFH